jgi:16S rRNA (guanine527-N7)-methyltransferase
MVTSDIIFKYFPDLSEVQKNQFRQLGDLYLFHNERVNLISRKDIQNLYTNHILHSLALAKFCDFLPGNHYGYWHWRWFSRHSPSYFIS